MKTLMFISLIVVLDILAPTSPKSCDRNSDSEIEPAPQEQVQPTPQSVD